MVQKCSLCQSQQNSTSSIQKYVSEVPPHPWHRVGSDLFYFRRIDFSSCCRLLLQVPAHEEDS